MPIFKGAGVAIVTPFTQDDKVNFEELGKMISRLPEEQMRSSSAEQQVNLPH